MYDYIGQEGFWGAGGQVQLPGSGCCDGDPGGLPCAPPSPPPGGYFEGTFNTPTAITTIVAKNRIDCCATQMEGFEVFYILADDPASGRRLFEADDEPPPGFTPTPTPTPEPSPSPTPEPPPDPEFVWGAEDADPDAWWNKFELSRREGELYTRRVLPDAHGRSAAASVAVAITLAHHGKSVLAGQEATLDAMCDALGGCDQGDYWTSIHDRDDADVNEDTPDPKHLPIDDAGWALQLLSRAIEPAVHAVIEGMLICLSPALCTSHCDVCNEWVGLGNATAEQVLRETELRLHSSIHER